MPKTTPAKVTAASNYTSPALLFGGLPNICSVTTYLQPFRERSWLLLRTSTSFAYYALYGANYDSRQGGYY
jgi:hypothetical protein